jgi:hypothetical protein
MKKITLAAFVRPITARPRNRRRYLRYWLKPQRIHHLLEGRLDAGVVFLRRDEHHVEKALRTRATVSSASVSPPPNGDTFDSMVIKPPDPATFTLRGAPATPRSAGCLPARWRTRSSVAARRSVRFASGTK